MAEWLNIITFGLLIFWNIIEIIKSIKINLTYYKITTIPLNKESYKFVNVCYLIGIIAFVFYIRNSIYTIIDMNKYEIPLLTRIATSKLMLNIYLFSLLSRAYWREYKCNFFVDDGIFIKNNLVSWEQIENYEINNHDVKINYINHKGHEKSHLVKNNKNSDELLKKIRTKAQ